MKSNTGEGRQALQQARLLGVAGKVDEAIAAYENCTAGCRMTLTSPLNTGRWWRACRPAIAKASAS